MQNLSNTVCQKFKDARRALGLTQAQLALEIGCHQAALSMFENGKTTKLSSEYVERLADRLKIDLKALMESEKAAEPPVLQHVASVGFCPDPECPSNVAYAVGERTLFRVTLQKGRYCALCGEVLERRCPSCGALPNEGACCTMCGSPYVHQ